MIACAEPFSMADSEDSHRGARAVARLARRAALGALAAELGHDLQGPLNLFRSTTERLERGEPLDAEDASLLREELERLSGINARLRALSRVTMNRERCTPGQLLARALSSDLGPPPPSLDVDLSAAGDFELQGDPALLARALRELVDNALEARRERAGVRFERAEVPCFCVWDDGEGFELEAGAAMRFGVTTRDGAAGLGLTLALRAARAHGFRLEFLRRAALTEARLVIVAPGAPGRSY
jgi:signal transduction histidine kinase